MSLSSSPQHFQALLLDAQCTTLNHGFQRRAGTLAAVSGLRKTSTPSKKCFLIYLTGFGYWKAPPRAYTTRRFPTSLAPHTRLCEFSPFILSCKTLALYTNFENRVSALFLAGVWQLLFGTDFEGRLAFLTSPLWSILLLCAAEVVYFIIDICLAFFARVIRCVGMPTLAMLRECTEALPSN
jgi:hypothetical protein